MLRTHLYHLLERDVSKSIASKIINGALIALILCNVTAVIFESNKDIGAKYHDAFFYFEILSVTIFTLEYFLRLWVCIDSKESEGLTPLSARVKYAVKPITIIDFLAVAPFYLSLIIPIDLRYLRLMRLLRLLKLTHYFKSLSIFLSVLAKEIGSLASAIFTMVVLVIISAGLMFSLEHKEQPEAFGSILDAMWWAVVTMTTVGYGDVVPITFGGKIIAIVIMLLGVGVVALPAAMLAGRFGEELQLRREQLKAQVAHALKDGIVSHEERKDLVELTENLELDKKMLDHMIDNQKARTSSN